MDTTPEPTVTDTPTTPTPDAAAPVADAGADAPWHDGFEMDDDTRALFTARGYDKLASPQEALAQSLKSARSAQTKLGAPAERVLVLPEEGADAEFMRANGERFGVPDSVEGYDFERPALPEGMVYDDALEKRMLTRLHEAGTPKHIAAAAVAEYATQMGEMYQQEAQALEKANADLTGELKTEWGQNYESRLASGQRAVAHFAQEAGLDGDATAAMIARLSEGSGDASVMRLFSAIGTAMGEDAIVTGKGASIGGALTRQQADSEARTIRDGDAYKAAKRQGGIRQQEMEREIEEIYKRVR